MRRFIVAAACWWGLFLAGASAAEEVRREIHFPDVPGYLTLKCDLHVHTVFSDGAVWPTVRVNEAWRQGLDAIAISDHIEYQPHKADIPTQHNRPYELMAGRAREKNVILIRGAEITRDTPPGHFNAIFLADVTPLDTPEFIEAIKQAHQQGAFVFWNHQGWKGEEAGRWLDVHTTLHENKLFQGMEVCNGDEYYPTAHAWCLEKGFTMLGNSDIHDPDLRLESTAADHRTMTLVLAKERTAAAIQEALQAGRTAVWAKDQLIGRPEWLEPLVRAGVQVSAPYLRSGNAVWVEFRNRCELEIRLERTGELGPPTLTLPPRSTVTVKINTAQPDAPLELAYKATNLLVAPQTGLSLTWSITGE